MIPKIQLHEGKDTFTRLEVEEMLDAISHSFEDIMRNEMHQYKFAKRISYLSLIVAVLLLGKELFLR